MAQNPVKQRDLVDNIRRLGANHVRETSDIVRGWRTCIVPDPPIQLPAVNVDNYENWT
jgi:hypothetical protein